MSEIAWQAEHSVESVASADFAWAYMTDVSHWDDPPAQFRLEGPFATGGRGTTEIPGQPSRSWRLRDVHPMESYTIEFSLDRATLSFMWQFRALPDGRSCLSQRITLEGKNAVAYVADIEQAFTSSLALGMNNVATILNRAYTALAEKQKSDADIASKIQPGIIVLDR
jgi:hypothetical protein